MWERLRKLDQGLRRTREAWFQGLTSVFQRQAADEALWQELEEILLGADVGMATTTTLLTRVRERVRAQGTEAIRHALRQEIATMLALDAVEPGALPSPSGPKPHTVLVVGVNGVGKTTSLAKLAAHYQRQGLKVLLAAADTFRAAAIDQLQAWGQRLGAPVVAHRPGADPGAVVYDALQASRARAVDVLLVDTAGRLHTKHNLMEELAKMRRVVSKFDPPPPLEVLLVLDATVGQNGLQQARTFTRAVAVNGILVAKLDGTARGGIVLAIAQELRLPIRFVGTGEKVEDLAAFDPPEFARTLLPEPEN